MEYKCERCGNCCRQAWAVAKYYPKDVFPYGVKADGSCEMLDENNLCKVYENRPLICNVKKMAEVMNVSEEEFYRENEKWCSVYKEYRQ